MLMGTAPFGLRASWHAVRTVPVVCRVVPFWFMQLGLCTIQALCRLDVVLLRFLCNWDFMGAALVLGTRGWGLRETI